MGFLPFLLILGIALSVPWLIAAVQPADDKSDGRAIRPPRAVQLKLHAHFEELPLALVAPAEQSLG